MPCLKYNIQEKSKGKLEQLTLTMLRQLLDGDVKKNCADLAATF